jgi:hypothetical protein
VHRIVLDQLQRRLDLSAHVPWRRTDVGRIVRWLRLGRAGAAEQ